MAEERCCSRCQKPFSRDDGLEKIQEICPDCLEEDAYLATEVAPEPEDPRQGLKPGGQFQGMEIIAILGQGGMGTVYKARQFHLDRIVALKILSPQLGNTPEFIERFQREARALAGLNHPNIVTIHDFGKEENLCYIIMEYIPGQNLRTLLRRNSLSPEEALDLVPQVCDAIQYAHREKIIHRDIKPENILLDSQGKIHVTDFGLAKMAQRKETDLQTITTPDKVMGTPNYMAPEQIETPTKVDHRADIYAIGVLLYELLTGELPIGKFPPPSRKTDLDPRIDSIVLKALEKEPDKRYQRAGEIREAVRELSESNEETDSEQKEKPSVPTSRKKIRLTLFLFLFLLVVPAAFYPFRDKIFPPQKEAGSEESPPQEKAVRMEDFFFQEQDAPGSFAFAQTTEFLPRNPFRAEKEDEIRTSVQNMNDQGILNLSPTRFQKVYTTAFFRWYLGFFAVEAVNEPAAKYLMQEARNWDVQNTWIKGFGNIVLLAFSHRKEFRYEVAFRQMVNRLCEKTGEPPPFSLPGVEFLELFERDLPPGSRFKGYPLLAKGPEALAEFATDFQDHVPVHKVSGIFRATISPSRIEVLAMDIPDSKARGDFRKSFEQTIPGGNWKIRENIGTLLLFSWAPHGGKTAQIDFDWIRGLYLNRITGFPYGDPWKERLSRDAAMDPRLFSAWEKAGKPPLTEDLENPTLTALLLTLSETDPAFTWTTTADWEKIWANVGRGKNGRISLLDPKRIELLGGNRARVHVLDQVSFTIGYRTEEESIMEFQLEPAPRILIRKGRIWEVKKKK